jgi:DNA-binding IscR family transcriptional regulator
MKLQKEVDEKLQSLGSRTNNGLKIVSYLYQRPIMNVNIVAEIASISLPSAYKLVGELEQLGIVQEITGAKRGKQYWFHEYINLFK